MYRHLIPPRPVADFDVAPLLSLEAARAHLRLDPFGSPPAHPDDAMIEGLVEVAREYIEGYTAQPFGVRRYLQVDPGFPAGPLWLRVGPLVSLVSVEYLDVDGALQSIPLANLDVDAYDALGSVSPVAAFRWPSVLPGPSFSRVRTTFLAGYGAAPGSPPVTLYPVPKSVIQAALLVLGHLYETREDSTEKALTTVPLGALALVQQFRTGQGL